MTVKRMAALLALLLLGSVPAFGWGHVGHSAIVLIASERLTPAAKAQIADLLDAKDATAGLEQYASWADEIRGSRPETSDWHYVDIEITTNGYNAAIDCKDDNCIVAQIRKDIAILKDKSLAKPVRAEALRFLIHFVGDIHQPLHCADNNDKGGNGVTVYVAKKRTNLHSLWDTAIVNAISTSPDKVAAQIAARITPALARQWQGGTPEQWANEGFAVAKRQIYAQFPGNGATQASIVLNPDYTAHEGPIAAAQLAKAGVRLAEVLNAVFK
jgi:hypothetical protein